MYRRRLLPSGWESVSQWGNPIGQGPSVCTEGRAPRTGCPMSTRASGANCSLLISVTIKGNCEGMKEDTVPRTNIHTEEYLWQENEVILLGVFSGSLEGKGGFDC